MKRGADVPRLRMEAVRSALRCRCSNQSTLYARTVITFPASNRSFSHFHSQVEHNASFYQYVFLFRRTLQKYTKFFNSRTSDQEIHIKCDGFVHCLAFGIRFRLRILVNGAVGRWATTKYSVGRGLYAPYHGLRRVAGRSICPI